MEELNIIPTEEPESGGSSDAGEQALDDATYEPNTYVESSGDYQQAEDIQANLVSVTENAAKSAEDVGATPLPIPRPEDQDLAKSQSEVRGDLDRATSGGKGSGGDEATPINLPDMGETIADDVGATPLPIPRPEDQGLAKSQSEVRGDLDQAASGSKGSGGEQATPINLPGPQEVAENLEQDLGDKLDASDQVQALPEKPLQEAKHEKPILHQELEDLDPGLSKLDDLDSLIPEPGKISGAPDQPGWSSDLKEGQFGASNFLGVKPGFEGGPDSLINAAEQSSDPHEPLPGMNSPILPGHGPLGGADVQGDGAKNPKAPPAPPKSPAPAQPPKDNKPSGKDPNAPKSTQKYPAFVVNVDRVRDAGQLVYNKQTGEFITMEAHLLEGPMYITGVAVEYLDASYKVFPWIKSSPEGGIGDGKDPNVPLSDQMDGERVDPKFDPGQVSNYPEDHIGGNLPTGTMRPVGAVDDEHKMEKVNTNKKSHKAGVEQITDPPEHDPNPKKSEAGGEAG
jgi:hypothetical protein